MDGFLLENSEGVLGLVVVDETRKIKNVAYLSDVRNLSVSFVNGDVETLATEIDQEFERSLFGRKKIFIGHFAHDGFDKEPSDEYYVPLDL
ncbi:MAG: hypothetical protein P4M13_05210 [Alphaproteobacteria bacterium]|nr:hypothetical protein [Alphaproteobacteria bacterium]